MTSALVTAMSKPGKGSPRRRGQSVRLPAVSEPAIEPRSTRVFNATLVAPRSELRPRRTAWGDDLFQHLRGGGLPPT